MLDIIGPAGPLIYPDQISCYRTHQYYTKEHIVKHTQLNLVLKRALHLSTYSNKTF